MTLDELALKGPRTYLQSADLWTAVERRLGGEPRRMSMTFRRLTDRIPQLVPLGAAHGEVRFADLRVTDAGKPVDYALIETATAVERRSECPEARLLPSIEIEGMGARVLSPEFATGLEALVAATKKLHLQQIDPSVKWVVGRLDLEMPFPAKVGSMISVGITHRLPRQTTVSAVAVEGRPVGTLMFNVLR